MPTKPREISTAEGDLRERLSQVYEHAAHQAQLMADAIRDPDGTTDAELRADAERTVKQSRAVEAIFKEYDAACYWYAHLYIGSTQTKQEV